MQANADDAGTGAHRGGDADDVARELSQLLMRGVPADFIAGPMAAALTAWALRTHLAPRALAWWLGLFLAAHVSRLLASVAARRLRVLRDAPRRTLLLARLSVLAVGCGWAVLPLWLFPSEPALALFVACVACAVCGAGMAEYSADTPSALLFVLPQLTPVIVHLLPAHDPLLRNGGVLATLYLGYLMHATWRTHGQFQTIARHRARAAAQLSRDHLTGLCSRLDLDQRLQLALARAARRGTQVAVGYIDLDRFKPVNDTLGHAAGDALLRELGTRWRADLRASELIARLGGDEFVVVVEDLDPASASAQMNAVFERLHRAVELPFELAGRSVRVSMTVGVALFPLDATEPDLLLRHADAAMYQGKRERDKAQRRAWWPAIASTMPAAPVAAAQQG